MNNKRVLIEVYSLDEINWSETIESNDLVITVSLSNIVDNTWI